MAFVPPHPNALLAVHHALSIYRTRTHYPYVPSASRLRACPIAHDLNLRQLITLAGGHRSVQYHLNLPAPPSANVLQREKEIEHITNAVRRLCTAESFTDGCPSIKWIRERDPFLANRISAVSGRRGYRMLQQKFVNAYENMDAVSSEKQEQKRVWGTWTRPEAIAAELLKYQFHPNVMPRLADLSTQLASAIQRKGGMERYADDNGLVLYRDWANIKRFSELVRGLSAYVGEHQNVSYIEAVKMQCQAPPLFPSTSELTANGMNVDITRYGGRRSLATRLGFERQCGYGDTFLGPFSVRFAADILQFAIEHCLVAETSVAMPPISMLRKLDKHDLADATEYLGGELDVGRRVGLVPLRRGRKRNLSSRS